MKLLMITRKVDYHDALAGFAWGWVKRIGLNLDRLYVISWQRGERGDLPDNIEIRYLPSSKLAKIFLLPYWTCRFLPRVDGLFCHMNPEYTILAGPWARLFGKRVVSWYTHGQVNLRRRLLELIANKVVTASSESFRRPWFPRQVEVLGHGIDLERFFPTSSRQSSDGLRLTTIGRISPTKDYESMIKAVEILTRDGLNISLNIIGDAGLQGQNVYFQELKQMVETMNLNGQVSFLGAVANTKIREHLWLTDIFINLSNTGSLDKAVLEAMACGCLVLTSNEAFESILPAELMVEKNNPQQLAAKIKQLGGLAEIEKNELAGRLVKEVKDNHDLSSLAKKIVNQFK